MLFRSHSQHLKMLPLVKEAFLGAGYGLDVLEGHIKIKKLKEARESGNEEDYNRRIDDIFN